MFSFLASAGTGTQEAFQLLTTANNLCYGVYYLLCSQSADRRHALQPAADLRPGMFLRLACLSGLAVTLLSMTFDLVPIVDVPHPWLFGAKVVLTALGVNLVGAVIYWRGTRQQLLALGTRR